MMSRPERVLRNPPLETTTGSASGIPSGPCPASKSVPLFGSPSRSHFWESRWWCGQSPGHKRCGHAVRTCARTVSRR